MWGENMDRKEEKRVVKDREKDRDRFDKYLDLVGL